MNTPLFLAYRVFSEDLPVIVRLPFDARTVTVLFEPDWLTDLEAFTDGRLIFFTSLDMDERII